MVVLAITTLPLHLHWLANLAGWLRSLAGSATRSTVAVLARLADMFPTFVARYSALETVHMEFFTTVSTRD